MYLCTLMVNYPKILDIFSLIHHITETLMEDFQVRFHLHHTMRQLQIKKLFLYDCSFEIELFVKCRLTYKYATGFSASLCRIIFISTNMANVERTRHGYTNNPSCKSFV